MKRPSQSTINAVMAVAMTVMMVVAFLPLIFVKWEPWQYIFFALAALTTLACRLAERPVGDSLTLRRLDRLSKASAFCYVLAAGFMIYYRYFAAFGYANYNWIAFLMAGALIQIYTSFRIDHELRKQERADKPGKKR